MWYLATVQVLISANQITYQYSSRTLCHLPPRSRDRVSFYDDITIQQWFNYMRKQVVATVVLMNM